MAAGLALLIAAPSEARQTLEISGEIDAGLRERLQHALEQRFASATPQTLRAQITPAASRNLVAQLRSEGYYGASVRTSFREDRIHFLILPGPRFRLADLTVTTAPQDAEAEALAQSAAAYSPGAPLRAEDVIIAESRALAALRENGWPDAQTGERAVIVDHDEANGVITYHYETGPFSRYGDIVLERGALRQDFIERLSPLERGGVARQSELRAYQARLNTLSSIARARISLGPPSGEGAERDLVAEWTPAARNLLEAGLNLSTSEGGGIGAAWTRRNLMGRDESLTLTARLATLEQSLEARLTAPHWRRLDQTLTLLSAVRNEDTDAYEQSEAEIEIDLIRRLGRDWSGGARLGADASRIRFNGQQLDTISVSSGVFAVRETRDSTIDPGSGARIAAELAPVVTFGDLDSAYLFGEVSLQSYRRLGDQFIAAGRVRLGSLAGADIDLVPTDQRFYAGGGGSVRGYDYQSLGPRAPSGRPTGGRSVIETNAELRWRGSGRWGGAVFADAGIASDAAAPELSDMRVGIGAGLRYHFEFAPLRADIAFPLDSRDDDAAFQIYIGLGQTF